MLTRGWRWTLLISLVTLLVVGHARVPHAFALGAIWETVLPWIGAAVPLAGLIAILGRSPAAGAATLALLMGWLFVCAPAICRQRVPAHGELRVVTHNVRWINEDPAGTARVLAQAEPDVVVLQNVRPDTASEYAAALAGRLPAHVELGRDAIWSRWPIHDARTLDLGPGWSGVHRAVVQAPGGAVVLYAVHMPRPNPRTVTQSRDYLLACLAAEIRADQAPRLLVAGDLNTGEMDRALRPLTEQLHDAVREAASGPAFTWPAWAPVVELDHVLSRGLRPAATRVLPVTGSDHRPLMVDFTTVRDNTAG